MGTYMFDSGSTLSLGHAVPYFVLFILLANCLWPVTLIREGKSQNSWEHERANSDTLR